MGPWKRAQMLESSLRRADRQIGQLVEKNLTLQHELLQVSPGDRKLASMLDWYRTINSQMASAFERAHGYRIPKERLEPRASAAFDWHLAESVETPLIAPIRVHVGAIGLDMWLPGEACYYGTSAIMAAWATLVADALRRGALPLIAEALSKCVPAK